MKWNHSMKESFYDRNHIGWASGGGGREPHANGLQAKSVLTKIAAFVADRNVSFPCLQYWNDRDVGVGRQIQNDSTRSRGYHAACQ